ncbi:MAG: 5-(carboxyamino)imidazole ribonucleotide mutase [Dehalococcoidia bacterium]|nr:5-(carboxyamino)imidazole ribonucleotide mutase [Dehalococcoidia bacterium]
MAKVGIIMGSKTDRDIVKPAIDMLEQLGIDYEVSIISSHRNPEKLREYGLKAEERGFEVIIAAAGGAAHLPGILASWTTLPIIGVPLPTTELRGVDALLSIAQMPAGVPVACVGIGASGAKNAALLAAQILGIKHEEVKKAYRKYKVELAEK